MNKYYDHFLNSKGNRDIVFSDVLNSFAGAQINILEIGAARNLDFYNRMSDGWSSFHYYSYIKKYGGSLTICDIDEGAIKICKTLFDHLDLSNIQFVVKDGLELINKSYDLLYLDGSDNPIDMVNQLQLINFEKQKVLCDDFQSKGSLAKRVFPNYTSYKWSHCDHELAFYRKNYKGSIILDAIQ